MTAREISDLLGGELVGDGDAVVTRLQSILSAGKGDVTFLARATYAARARASRASVILVGRDWKEPLSQTLIRVDNPSAAFQKLTEATAPPPVKFAPGIHSTAVIAPDVKLGCNVSVQPYAVIEPGVEIGDGTVIGAYVYVGHEVKVGSQCHLYPHVVIRDRCLVGNRVIMHPGVVIGADGFGYDSGPQGHKKIPQLGIVEIEDDVEIGANTTIDRARFDRTLIRQGTKIDNMVQIGHNVIIGRHSIICAQVGISGSCVIGDGVILAGQVGLADHLNIGDGAVALAKSGLHQDVPPKGKVFGAVARPAAEEMKLEACKVRLPELFARVKQIEKRLGEGGEEKKG
ncbi:MAG: UDP-3-O-(3-hydroxymyristoyl)glucosamine N-acyltransferase [Verrucomicrobia bacterium]|nr:UDP-3-O-(3-hydroxymyristoyl)glucosamine N-acyltransferase [Verrucomicrobiota bacterium]